MQLDKFLPTAQFSEFHCVTVNAAPKRVFTAIQELTTADFSWLVFLLMEIRYLPARLTRRHAPVSFQSGLFLEQLYQGGFIPLAEEPGREIVFGLIGQFWKLSGGEAAHIPDPQAFLAFNDPAYAKVAANLLVMEDGDGQTRFSTETRVYAPVPSTRRKFAFYWRIISMGSAVIRVLWLKAIKKKAERVSGSTAPGNRR
jgi:hypothetical protein